MSLALHSPALPASPTESPRQGCLSSTSNRERRGTALQKKGNHMRHTEPPSPDLGSRTPLFLIGRDREGHWVVRDLQGRRGGLFVDRTEALKYALFENGKRPQAVVMVPGILDLDMSGPRPDAAAQPAPTTPALVAVAA
jgi:hypothetical protein